MDLKEVNWWAGWPFTCKVSAMPVCPSLGQTGGSKTQTTEVTVNPPNAMLPQKATLVHSLP